VFNKNYSQPTVSQTWHLAWGKVSKLTGSTWQDQQLAIFPSQPSHGISPQVTSPSGNFVIVGDVWLSNRQQLLRLQGTKDSDLLSDLKLVARVWDDWGIDTFTKILGVFGLAIWDRTQQKLWLGRDRIGGKSLYYTNSGSTRWIAPNLRSLRPHHNGELDLVALRDYLCCAFVPGAKTLWQGVRELRPGTVICFPAQEIQTYWKLPEYTTAENAGDKPSLEVYSQQLRRSLEEVVQDYLPVGKPVGVFLSGGLDSSSITALASQLHSEPVHTFSIHFGANCANELEFSSLVANHCRTNHHILEITFQQMWERLPETMAWLDDPIGDGLTVPNLLIGQLAKDSVGVILNGEGGDPRAISF